MGEVMMLDLHQGILEEFAERASIQEDAVFAWQAEWQERSRLAQCDANHEYRHSDQGREKRRLQRKRAMAREKRRKAEYVRAFFRANAIRRAHGPTNVPPLPGVSTAPISERKFWQMYFQKYEWQRRGVVSGTTSRSNCYCDLDDAEQIGLFAS